jgi:predicted MFS family arabinose efflux permease
MALRLVLFLTLLNLFNYTDRYLMAASLLRVKADFALSDLQGGMLFSAFIVPYLVFSLILAYRADRTNRIRILKIGTLIWSSAAVLTAFAEDYYQVMFCRSLLGVGEAAFAAVAPAVVTQLATTNSKAKFMSLFTAGLPLGLALGFIGGGSLTGHFGWRFSFLALGLPALVISIAFLFVPSGQDQPAQESLKLSSELKSLITNKRYVTIVMGYAAYMFVAGGVTHWMPSYIVKYHTLSLSAANGIFGGAAIVFGLLGTWAGGVFGDRWNQKLGEDGLLKVSWLSMVLALGPFTMVFFAGSIVELAIWISLAQFFMFASTSPIITAALQAAKARQVSFAMAMLLFTGHILGDSLSAPWIGFASDRTGDLRWGLMTCLPMLMVAAALWSWPSVRKKFKSV